jgi:hypothetical protein
MVMCPELQRFWVSEQRDLHGDDRGAHGSSHLANPGVVVPALRLLGSVVSEVFCYLPPSRA